MVEGQGVEPPLTSSEQLSIEADRLARTPEEADRLRELARLGATRVHELTRVAMAELGGALSQGNDEILESCLRKLSSCGELARLRALDLAVHGRREWRLRG